MSTILNTHQAAAVFGVTPMTLANWRKGTPRRTKLPTVKPPKTASPISIWYEAQKLKVWAAKNGIPLVVDPLVVPEQPASKPGPKVSAKPAKAAATSKKSTLAVKPRSKSQKVTSKSH